MEDGIPVSADGFQLEVFDTFYKGVCMKNADRAGRVEGTLMNGKREICAHQRLVDEQVNIQGEKTGHLVCRECGEVIHDPVEV
jgi:hypothetical protein